MLGFVEGEGSPEGGTSNTLTFNVGQSVTDLALMVEIKNFFNNLPGEYKIRHSYDGVVSLSVIKSKSNSRRTDSSLLLITNLDYIKNVLIPFFDSMI